MTAWVGGFMFYGGAVVSILEDALGRFEAGMITRRVTVALNGVGIATVCLWLCLVWFERGDGPRRIRLARSWSLGLSTASLVLLIVLHAMMSRHLDERGTSGFRPWHRAYLLVSTLQWVFNLAILASSLHLWANARPRIGPIAARMTDPDVGLLDRHPYNSDEAEARVVDRADASEG
jgi:hypothetical protein